MGGILVHEFMTVDGIIDTPSWTCSTNCERYDNGVIHLGYAPYP
jgi:hypothetical protein